MNGRELFPDAKTPSSPLTILQAELEAMLQLVNHTVRAYESTAVKVEVQGGRYVRGLAELGYTEVLCNMGLVSAVAGWEGFKGNTIRRVRERRLSIDETRLEKYARETDSHERILEPCERRDCITHNMGKVDSKYLKCVTNSSLELGDSVAVDLRYLSDASEGFFAVARELVGVLVAKGLLTGQDEAVLGEFQRGP